MVNGKRSRRVDCLMADLTLSGDGSKDHLHEGPQPWDGQASSSRLDFPGGFCNDTLRLVTGSVFRGIDGGMIDCRAHG